MERRTFIVGTLALAGTAVAQSQRLYRIGLFDYSSADPGRLNWWKAFRERMRQLGYVEGKQIAYEPRFASGRADRVRPLAAELVKLKLDAIVVAGTPAVIALKQETTTIPIVTTVATDLVAVGLVKNFARPGENLTGVTSMTSLLAAKRLEVLRTFVPGVSKVGLLFDESNPASRLAANETRAAATALAMMIVGRDLHSAVDVQEALKAVHKERVQALVLVSSPALFPLRTTLAGEAIKMHVPTITGSREWADAGAFISYGTDYPDLFRRGAEYVDKILKGAKPGDLSIELPDKFELVVNMKTAKALGINIPESVLVRADAVIQ